MHLLSNHLYIVSTPIGNLDDITLRALDVLKQSDIILCEDTRRSIKLLNHYKIKKKLISYHKFNEKKKLAEIIKYFNEGKILSLISDAGTPLLSDPGRMLVNECIEHSITVTPVPGVSSIISALSVSGFSDKFLFYGFLPKTENQLEKVLSSISKKEFTQIFFIPSKKLNFYIKSFKKFYSGRKILIAKEITKIHEAFIREQVDKLQIFKNIIKGELTVVISENINNIKKFDQEKIVNKIKKYLKNYSLKDTVNLILETENANKKQVYDLCLRVRDEENF
jgi:16S rRNA (cytidine1402-2'-O)-methyltransferase